MAVAAYLADTSALARLAQPTVAERLMPLLADGTVATCGVAMLELLFSTRSPGDYAGVRDELKGVDRVPIDDQDFDRALEVQAQLAAASQHRGVPLPDLLIAAAAQRAGLVVLHYDADYDRIAAVTGQATEWVVERGTVN